MLNNFKIEDVIPWEIVFAASSNTYYEMYKIIVTEHDTHEGDWPEDRVVFTAIIGYHNSCYDFDKSEWEATQYTPSELKKVVEKCWAAPYNPREDSYYLDEAMGRISTVLLPYLTSLIKS